MTVPDDSQNEIAEFAREIVSRLAPQEIRFFDDIEAQFYRDPKAFTRVASDNDPLQFGLPHATHLVTPAAIAATAAVLHYLRGFLSDVAKDVAKKVASTVLTARVQGVQGGRSDVLLVTPEQIVGIRRMARQEAMKYGVPDSVANAMADEIVRSLGY